MATPLLGDPSFDRTVVLLLQADEDDGALGLVLNRPAVLAVDDVLEDWSPLGAAPAVVFEGGPVQPEAAVCLGHARVDGIQVGAFSPLEHAPAVGTVDLDASPDELRTAVSEVRVFAGYAGWSPGQLEAELEEGAWWLLDALPSDAFSVRAGAVARGRPAPSGPADLVRRALPRGPHRSTDRPAPR